MERLTRALRRPQEVLEFIPYWDPDPRTEAALTAAGGAFHYVQMSKPKHLYLLQDAKRLARRLDVPMRWPIDVDPWWELPHLGFLAARERGAGEAFYREVIAARWQRGEDVCTPEVLAGVAERAGVDPAVVLGAVDDDAAPGRRGGLPDARLRRRHLRHPVPAVRPAPVLGFRPGGRLPRRLGDRAGAPARPAEPVPAGAGGYDTDTGGGCG